MRLHIITTGTKDKIPFNYQPLITGTLHKWLGGNTVHDKLSLYCFSWLNGGIASRDGIHFKHGANFFISAYDPNFLGLIIKGIKNDPEINYGLNVSEIIIQEEPVFKDEEVFFTASPILVKRRLNNQEFHYSFKDNEANSFLSETLKHKLRTAGLPEDNLGVEFYPFLGNPKTKVIYYKNIGNKVNLCPVKITGTQEQISFAWNVGIGNSTGIGFGALK